MWFKVDDKLHDHPKVIAAGKAAMGVWVLAGAWASDNLTDGFVPARVLGRWGTTGDARRLVEAGLWEAARQGAESGWRFHDWDGYQPSRDDVESRRVAEREKKARWREKSKRAPETGQFTPADNPDAKHGLRAVR